MTNPDRDPFYVGYEPRAPRAIRVHMTVTVVILLGFIAMTAWFAGVNRQSPGPGTFEYGVARDFEGRIVEEPFPMLRVARPGTAHATASHSVYTLVVFGKHGAGGAVRGLDGSMVRLRGALIYRDEQVMLEIEPESIEVLAEPDPLMTALVPRKLSRVTLIGEIVDSKCFYGVMKPGNLKPHKACAVRCISGGIPPVLAVSDKQGEMRYFILVSPEGKPINEQILDLVAEPVRVTGRVVAYDNVYFLYTDPASFVRL